MSKQGHRTIFPSEILTIVCLLYLQLHAAWLYNSRLLTILPPLLWVSGLLVVVLILRPFIDQTLPNAYARHSLPAVLKDPVFLVMLAFTAFIAVQWMNSDRSRVYDTMLKRMIWAPPHFPSLPSSVASGESVRMFFWFVPAFATILGVRHGLQSRKAIWALLWLMAVHAGCFALFGIIQQWSGTREMFWTLQVFDRFYASFGYTNHAGSFFLLLFALCMGLLVDAMFRPNWRFTTRLWASLSAVLIGILLFISVHQSLCVAAIALVWCCLVTSVGWTFATFWNRLPPVGRLNLVLTYVAMLSLVGTVSFRLYTTLPAGKEVMRAFSATELKGDIELRITLGKAAIAIWNDNRLFGVGGWGYRQFVKSYMPKSEHHISKAYGLANVHNDFLQFLAEFGAVGTALLLTPVIICLFTIVKYHRQNRGLLTFCMVGICCTTIHSLIDLPFRSACIIFSWSAILACVAKYKQLLEAECNGRIAGTGLNDPPVCG